MGLGMGLYGLWLWSNGSTIAYLCFLFAVGFLFMGSFNLWAARTRS